MELVIIPWFFKIFENSFTIIFQSKFSSINFLLGTHIPIKKPEIIKETKPDYVVILSWNFKDEIVEQMKYVRDWGGKFVVLHPKIEIF